MAGRHVRNLIRFLVGTALFAALVTCAAVPIPEDLPPIALQQAGLYRLEVALLVFYGSLLLITPTFSGLIRGRLPIEISVRGARFEEKADRSVELTEAKIEKLRQRTNDLDDGLAVVTIEIDRLKKRG